jgi:hypothetical protein
MIETMIETLDISDVFKTVIDCKSLEQHAQNKSAGRKAARAVTHHEFVGQCVLSANLERRLPSEAITPETK